MYSRVLRISNNPQYLIYADRCFTRVEQKKTYNHIYAIHILNAETHHGYAIIMFQLCQTISTILDQYFPSLDIPAPPSA